MRKLLTTAALCMAAILVFAPAALAQEDPCPDPDFPRQTPDGCQASDLPDVVPGASASASASVSPAPSGEEFDCDDFESQGQAQEFYRADKSDPSGLDADDDGIACETFDYGDGGGTGAGVSQYTPSGVQYGPQTGVSTAELPDTGGPSGAVLALPSLALLVAGGIFAARIVRK